jgi:hypothetical protein
VDRPTVATVVRVAQSIDGPSTVLARAFVLGGPGKNVADAMSTTMHSLGLARPALGQMTVLPRTSFHDGAGPEA